MTRETILITGANGEIGQGLISHLGRLGSHQILSLDIQPLTPSLEPYCHRIVQGDILDLPLLQSLFEEFLIGTIYHLASILSTKAEQNPEKAHQVNVDGTINLLHLSIEHARLKNRPVKFIYPSSIAVYGMPDLETKARAGQVTEDAWCIPTTMYGCSKLSCEHLGRYYARHYQQQPIAQRSGWLDFRCLRFPGLISADTIPAGGTTDFGPEMLHQAAQGIPYACFVRPDTRLPFMAMPDAIKALTAIEAAPLERLSRQVYNVTGFSLSAKEFRGLVVQSFPQAEITFEVDACRQAIVDTWPADLNDSMACKDWNWKPDYNLEHAFNKYLVPCISRRYREKV